MFNNNSIISFSLLYVIIYLLVNNITAQPTFSANFDNEYFGTFKDHPEFTILDEDGLEPKFDGMGKSWYHPDISVRRAATSTSKFVKAGKADNWLITPKIYVPISDPYLKWVAATIFDGLKEDYEILISTKGKDIEHFIKIADIVELTHSYTTHDLSLEKYSGDSIFIAFRHISDDKRELTLQNIEVGGRKPFSLDVLGSTLDKYVLLQSEINVEVEIVNSGSNIVNSFRINWRLGKDTIHHQWVNGKQLKWNESVNVTLEEPVIFYDMGIIPIEFWIDSINRNSEIQSESIVLKQIVYPVEESVKKRVYIEEMTGTWCQACPPGGLLFQELLEKYDDVIGGSFHKNDIMSTSDMQPIIDEYAAFLPGGLVDRVPIVGKDRPYRNAGQWEPGIISQLTKISPIELEIITSYNHSSREIDITLIADYYVDSDVEYRFNVVIVEDSVTGGDLYDQANAGNNNILSPFYMKGDPMKGYVHRDVIRGLLGGAWGFENNVPQNTHSGDHIERHFTYVVPYDYRADQIKIIGLIQEYNDYLYDRRIINCVASQSVVSSTNNNQIKNNILVYPNPSSDYVIIEKISLSELLEVNVVSTDGVEFEIKEWNFDNSMLFVNTKELPSGLYYFRLKGNSKQYKNEIIMVQFIIQH